MKHIFYLFVALFFLSCGNEKGKDFPPTPGQADTSATGLQNEEKDFVSFLKELTVSNINQYIHPEKGLWLIQSDGAMPTMTNTTQVDKNFPVDFSNMKDEELPKVNCDSKSFWTKEGCFVQQINTFKDEKIWTVGDGLEKSDLTMFEDLAKSISRTAINTSLNARYYFGRLDGKWYLIFADLRKPCEA